MTRLERFLKHACYGSTTISDFKKGIESDEDSKMQRPSTSDDVDWEKEEPSWKNLEDDPEEEDMELERPEDIPLPQFSAVVEKNLKSGNVEEVWDLVCVISLLSLDLQIIHG